MSLSARQELALSLSPRYRQAKHPIKQKILDEFTAATHYHRKYALVLLSRDAHKNQDTKERRKPRTYNAEVKDALVAVWQASYRLCSKRLVPFLPEFLSVLERHGHLSLADEVRSQLLTISPATVDRLLCDGRHRTRRRSFGGTRPGSLLKHHTLILGTRFEEKAGLLQPVTDKRLRHERRFFLARRRDSPSLVSLRPCGTA